MGPNVEKIFDLLGVCVEDIEHEPEFNLLIDLLSQVDAENVISFDEAEMLENADIIGMGEVEVLKALKKHGIEDDDMEVDEDDLQYIRSKLSYIVSDVWDGINSDLRKLQKQLERTVQELKEKSINISSELILNCENEWKRIDACFHLFFQDLEEMNELTKNPENDETLKLFFDNFMIEVSKFIQYATHCINKHTETPVLNLNLSAESGVIGHKTFEDGENICSSSLHSSLATTLYQINLKYSGIGMEDLLLAPAGKISLDNEVLSNANEKYLLSCLTFSEKWAELQIKQNVILPVFEENKKKRETILISSNNLLPVLKKQVELQYFVSLVISLWNLDRNVVSELVFECKQYLDQEIVDVVSRVDYLNDVKTAYETFFGSDEYINCTLIEKLNRLSDKHYPSAENKYLKESIEKMENELFCVVNDQRLCLINSKHNIWDIEKYIQEIFQNLHSNLEQLSQLQELYSESSKLMQIRKEEVEEVTDQLLEYPQHRKLRLMWVYFLTNQQGLQDLKEEIDMLPNDIAATPVSFQRSSYFVTSTPNNAGTPVSVQRSTNFVTSTPKKDEG